MDYEISISRDSSNALQAKTTIPLAQDRRELRITTSKNTSRGGIGTHASVVQVSEDGRLYSHMLFQDYSKQIARDAKGRATEKNIRAMHALALESLPAILAEVTAQYGYGAKE